MDPIKFQELANSLAKSTEPAQLRTAVSRAYYAAYNYVGAFLNRMGFTPRRGPKGHRDTRDALIASGNKVLETTAQSLADLSGKRVKADYRMTDTTVETPLSVGFAVRLGEQIITDVKNVATNKVLLSTVEPKIRAFTDKYKKRA